MNASRRRRGLARIVAGMVLATWLLSLPVAATDPVLAPKVVGKLDLYPDEVARRIGVKSMTEAFDVGPQGTAVVSERFDRLYQIWTFAFHERLGDRTVIAVRDLGSLRLLDVIQVPGRTAMKAINNATGVEWVHTFDRKGGRLFLEYGKEQLEAGTGFLDFGFIVVDLKTHKWTDNPIPRGLVRMTSRLNAMFGLEYDETTDTLVGVLAGLDENFQTVSSVSVVGWDGTAFDGGLLPAAPPGFQGPRLLRACRRETLATIQSTRLNPVLIARGPDLASLEVPRPERTWVTIPCLSTPYSVNNVIVRMDRATMFNPQGPESAVPAPSGIANWIIDEPNGRLHLLNASQETNDWVYEVESNSFIGIIELSPKGVLSPKTTGLGVDATGRLIAYGVHNQIGSKKLVGSLMISEAGQDPVPQADIFNVDSKPIDADATVLIDGKRNRVLVLKRIDPGGNPPTSWDTAYTVYEIPAPLPESEPLDPDSLTKQVPEDPAKTTSEFGGTATAYGARVLLSSGFGGAPPTNGNNDLGDMLANANSNCGFRDREIVLGGMTEAELGSSVKDALAEAVHLDGNTIQDFGQPSRCDLYFQYAGPTGASYTFEEPIEFTTEDVKREIFFSGLMRKLQGTAPVEPAWEKRFNDTLSPHTTWEYKPAECGLRNERDEPGRNANRFAGVTGVDCKKDGDVRAFAESSAVGALGSTDAPIPIRIGKASSFTRVYRDPKRGLVSEAVSKLENVQIGPLTIGSIENRAVAFAGGRMGTAGTEAYRPRLTFVSGPGFTSCTYVCNLDAFIPTLNNTFIGRMEFRTLAPEARLAKGSPGGYEAGIIKSPKQKASDNSLVGDKSSEVPALEVVIYNDNPKIGRARQVVQLAGVRADAHYGIQLFDEGIPCDTPDCIPLAPPEPQIVEVPGPPQIVTVAQPGVTRTITRGGAPRVLIPGGYRLLLANPKAAGTMATVWLFLAAPFVVAARRRRLSTLD